MPSPLPRRSRLSLGWLAFVVALASITAGVGYAQQRAPLSVTVAGQKMTSEDVLRLSIYPMSCESVFPKPLQKPPEQMPSASPYVYYAGKDAAGKPIAWESNATQSLSSHDPLQPEIYREWIGVCLLETLDGGRGTPAWQRAFAMVKDHPEQWPAFGRELTDALRQMSRMTVARSNADRAWLFKHLPAGTTRVDADRILRSRGLVEQKGVVSLPGAFEPGCYTWTAVTITFDANGRIYKIDLKPVASCL